MSLSSAKAKLDAQGGDPVTGYISKTDHQESYDELVDDTALTGATTAEALDVTGALTAGTIASDATVAGTGLAGGLLSSANPIINGVAAPGTSAIPSRQDHVHASERRYVPLPASYYWANGRYVTSNTITSTQGRCIFWIIDPPEAHTITEMSVRMASASGAGALLRFGFWTVGSDGKPGTLLGDAGTLDPTGATGVKTISGLSIALPAAYIYAGMALQGSGSGGGTMWTADPTAHPTTVDQPFGSAQPVVFASGLTGAFASTPAVAGTGGWDSGYNVPMVTFRRSA